MSPSKGPLAIAEGDVHERAAVPRAERNQRNIFAIDHENPLCNSDLKQVEDVEPDHDLDLAARFA